MKYLDAVFIQVSGHGKPSLFICRFTEDDNLLKEEDSSLLHPIQQASIWFGHHECVLQQKTALSDDLTLRETQRQRC